MTKYILYIPPAMTELAGQCRIYATSYPTANPRVFYDKHPDLWREVGIMGHDGRVVCIDSDFAALRDDVPLMAGGCYPMTVADKEQAQ